MYANPIENPECQAKGSPSYSLTASWSRDSELESELIIEYVGAMNSVSAGEEETRCPTNGDG